MAGFTVNVRQTSPYASEATIRGHRVTVDRPAEKGGTDEGPMGGELFLAAVGGCFMSTLLAAIRGRESQVPIENAAVEVTGSLSGSPARFTAVDLRVSADCDEPELLEKLAGIAARGCIMINTLRDSLNLTIQCKAVTLSQK